MKKTILAALGIVALVLVVWALGSYNGLVTAEEQVETQWAQVETSYQRRLDLIPNLVEATKGVMAQERAVFTALAEARAAYAGNPSAENANQVEGALARLLAIVENYPQLRSSETVASLMVELAGTENRISVERMRYNEEVLAYNLKVRRFPGKLAAAVFGFDEKEQFAAVAGAQNAPKVDLQLE